MFTIKIPIIIELKYINIILNFQKKVTIFPEIKTVLSLDGVKTNLHS